MIYFFNSFTIIHKIGYEMGLKHPFKENSTDIARNQKYLQQIKQSEIINERTINLVEEWKEDYKTRKLNEYRFTLGTGEQQVIITTQTECKNKPSRNKKH